MFSLSKKAGVIFGFSLASMLFSQMAQALTIKTFTSSTDFDLATQGLLTTEDFNSSERGSFTEKDFDGFTVSVQPDGAVRGNNNSNPAVFNISRGTTGSGAPITANVDGSQFLRTSSSLNLDNYLELVFDNQINAFGFDWRNEDTGPGGNNPDPMAIDQLILTLASGEEFTVTNTIFGDADSQSGFFGFIIEDGFVNSLRFVDHPSVRGNGISRLGIDNVDYGVVPTPAAVLPVLTGLFAAAKRRNIAE